MKILKFRSEEELVRFWKMYLSIPRRTEGRTTAHVELATFGRYVIHRSKAPFWSYPVTMLHQDRPDFAIESSLGKIGVEVTEQWSQSFGHALALHERSLGLMEPSDFSFDGSDRRRTGRTLGALVEKTKLTGPPSMGDCEERRWAMRTAETTNLKALKVATYPDVEDFDAVHLCIFDVRPEHPRFEELTEDHLHPLYDSEASKTFAVVACIDTYIVQVDLITREFSLN